MLTIQPRLFSFILGRTARVIQHVELMFISSIASTSSSDSSWSHNNSGVFSITVTTEYPLRTVLRREMAILCCSPTYMKEHRMRIRHPDVVHKNTNVQILDGIGHFCTFLEKNGLLDTVSQLWGEEPNCCPPPFQMKKNQWQPPGFQHYAPPRFLSRQPPVWIACG